MTSNGELCAIVEMAVDFAIMLIIRILWAKDGVAKGTCKMFYMVLFIERCYVRSTEGSATCFAQEIDTTEIIGFAECVFQSCIRFLDREEFLGDRDVAFLHTHQLRGKASGGHT